MCFVLYDMHFDVPLLLKCNCVILWLSLSGEMVEQIIKQIMVICCRCKFLAYLVIKFYSQQDEYYSIVIKCIFSG